MRRYLLLTFGWLVMLASLVWLLRVLLARAGWQGYASLSATSHTALPGVWLRYTMLALVVLIFVFVPPALALWVWLGVTG